MANNGTYTSSICHPGLILPLLDESKWNPFVRGTLYFIALLYSFIGVSVITDIFMASVVIITSKTKKVYLANPRKKSVDSTATEEETDYMEVRVWNDTVANLTLLALGTSAPEILLACIEIVGRNFEAGDLGPGTIVGSGAFNLLIITSICLMSIPKGEVRRIRSFKVFLVCSGFNVFAYIWLWVVISYISPQVVEFWEAILTLFMFPSLVLFAYIADKGWLNVRPFRRKFTTEMEVSRFHPEQSEKKLIERKFFKHGKISRKSLVCFVRELKKYPGVTDEDAALLAASKIVDAQPQTTAHYRIDAVRNLTGSRKTRPYLNDKLREVYKTINKHPDHNLGTIPEISPGTHAVVEFHAATYAVHESIGSFKVLLWRHGNLEPKVTVRVESVDGSAKAGEDYVKINEIIIFEPGETEKEILIEIMDDHKWEPDEEFFLKISLLPNNYMVQLGRISIMEITIIDDDQPGVISFEKRGVLVKESAETVVLQVHRKFGADGEVSVNWRTIDQTAVSGKDYIGQEGVLLFKHREVLKTIEISIIDDMRTQKDQCFFVELYDPTNNAALGEINKTCVTITNDDAFVNIIDKMIDLTKTNLDSVAICRKSWRAQIKDAMNVNGGDIENATGKDYLLHFISFNWKILFSFIPPATLLGGWLCFFVSLLAIGLVTALVGDIACVFGCVVGLRDATTAITLVAMGTSLPDTFASRAAALKESHADNSIGNINGSNAVNVFLGLGMPWLLATSYHMSHGSEFRVASPGLSFSVLLFFLVALLSIGLLMFRRYMNVAGKAELGGPTTFKYVSGSILLLLWLFYVLMSCLQEYKYITLNI